jgi:hypothetical protein
MPGRPEPIVESRSPRRLVSDLTVGLAAGLVIGLVNTNAHAMVSDSGLHEVPWGDYLVIWPVLGLVAGYSSRRGAAPLIEDRSDASQERQDRTRGRFVTAGLAIGVAVGLITTSIDVAQRGWSSLQFQLILRLLLYPYIGVLIGFNLSRVPGDPKWSWRFMRFNMRTMMLLVAYIALLFGLGVETGRLATAARRYHQQYVTANQTANWLGDASRLCQAQAQARYRNAKALRRGAIPPSIPQHQQDFLQWLDTDEKATPERRKEHYDSIAAYEESQGHLAETNARQYATSFEYSSKLAAKYEKAERNPWAAVEPDPPSP